MNISATVSGNRYGGYNCDNFMIHVSCKRKNLDIQSSNEFRKELHKLLIGKRSPIKISTYSNVIVYPGEVFSTHRITEIINAWYWTKDSLMKSRWAKSIRSIQKRIEKKLLQIEFAKTNESMIEIKISFTDKNLRQAGGALEISPATATWLSKALAKAARADISDQGIKANFRRNKKVSR